MDKLTLLGLVLGITGIMTGQILEGGDLSILFQGAAFVIVLGGTLGAVLVQCQARVLITALRMGKWAFVEPQSNGRYLVRQITDWSVLARRDGVLALEARLPTIKDPFLKKGLQLLVDGTSPGKIREVLDVDIHRFEQLRWQSARVWEAAAGYSPTIGIIGAVLGLIHVMQNLGEPAKLGGGIAVAFVATIYGVGSANLIFIPIAKKIINRMHEEVFIRELIVEGVLGIESGVNPYFLRTRLNAFLADRETVA